MRNTTWAEKGSKQVDVTGKDDKLTWQGKTNNSCPKLEIQTLHDAILSHEATPSPSCTGELQPLDVGFNGPWKKLITSYAGKWLAEDIRKQLEED